MYDLLSVKEIKRKFKMELHKDVSLQAIHHVAQKIGYKERHVGGKVGYHRSVYTALTQHFRDLVAYDSAKAVKTPQKGIKKPMEITWDDENYITYNGERDNVDYDWEKNESLIRRAILEAIDKILKFNNKP